MLDPARPRTLRVLVVDDNRDAADSLALLLRLWGHDVRVAYDGPSGLAAATAFLPDAAFLDVQMPGMHGGRLAAALRQTPDLETALLVATSATPPEVLGHEAQVFDHYLVKPYNLTLLESLLGARAAAL